MSAVVQAMLVKDFECLLDLIARSVIGHMDQNPARGATRVRGRKSWPGLVHVLQVPRGQWKRTYISTTRRITSGDELKYRNGLGGFFGRGMSRPTPAPRFCYGYVCFTAPIGWYRLVVAAVEASDNRSAPAFQIRAFPPHRISPAAHACGGLDHRAARRGSPGSCGHGRRAGPCRPAASRSCGLGPKPNSPARSRTPGRATCSRYQGS
jgi:hypothetical protein